MKPDIRELTLKRGLGYASDTELVMLILGSGSKAVPVDRLASTVVRVLGQSDRENLVESLLKIKGMGEGKALSIAAACELGRRRNSHNLALVKHPSDIVPFVRAYSMFPQEHFICICLNGAHEIMNMKVVSVGTVDQTLVHPRDVFCQALKENAAAVIVAHNHPSGNCSPSREDVETTEILLKGASLLGLELLDHVIFDKSSYFSFMENDILFKEKRGS